MILYAYSELRDPAFVNLLCRYDMAAVQTVFDIPFALPSTSLAAALSYYIERLPRGANTYQELYESRFWAERCPGPDGKSWDNLGTTSDDGKFVKLYVSHFAGALVALVVIIAAAWTQLESGKVAEAVVHHANESIQRTRAATSSSDGDLTDYSLAIAEYLHKAFAQLVSTKDQYDPHSYVEKHQYYKEAIERVEKK